MAVDHWCADAVWCKCFTAHHILSYNTVKNYKLQKQYRNKKNDTGDRVDVWLITLFHYQMLFETLAYSSASKIQRSLVSHRSRESMSIARRAIDERPCWIAIDAKVISKHKASVRRDVASTATSSNFHIWNIDAWHRANNRLQSFSALPSSYWVREEIYTCCDCPSMKCLWNEERVTPDDWQPVVELFLLR